MTKTKIKYMGGANIRTLPKGLDFGGQLADPLEQAVVFNSKNNWVVDSDEAGLSKEAVELLTESGDFKDVTKQKRVEPNRHQQVFMGMKAPGENDEDEDEDEAVTTTASATDSTAEKTTTTGGSTAKTTGKK